MHRWPIDKAWIVYENASFYSRYPEIRNKHFSHLI